jgi:hypothetical protein
VTAPGWPTSLWRWLVAAVAGVAALGLAVELLHAHSPGDTVEALLHKLSLSYEGNLPTWLSSSLLLCAALTAASIARLRPPRARHWWGIAGVAAWMSLDEAAELHEHLGGLIQGTGGLLYFDWVIPASVIVLAIAVIYLPFVRDLDELTRRRLIIAAAVYIAGALLMELPLGAWTEAHGSDGEGELGYALIDWVEETLELVGVAYALVTLIAHREELRRGA